MKMDPIDALIKSIERDYEKEEEAFVQQQEYQECEEHEEQQEPGFILNPNFLFNHVQEQQYQLQQCILAQNALLTNFQGHMGGIGGMGGVGINGGLMHDQIPFFHGCELLRFCCVEASEALQLPWQNLPFVSFRDSLLHSEPN